MGVIVRVIDALIFNVHILMGNYRMAAIAQSVQIVTQIGATHSHARIRFPMDTTVSQVIHAIEVVAKMSAGVVLGIGHGNVDVPGDVGSKKVCEAEFLFNTLI